MTNSLAEDHAALFRTYGLVRDHKGYAKLTERISAFCSAPDCGAPRQISVTELLSGATPCLSCAKPVDPDAPHVVYMMHFPALRAYKIGITNTNARQCRITAHRANGGTVVAQCKVPNKEAALTVERQVLHAVRDHPSGCTERDFPQGGHTETWSENGPAIDLGALVKSCHIEEAPGFGRLRALEEYFAHEPATLSELAEFCAVDVVEVDGTLVHTVGLSEPREQVLRKIRARRNTHYTGM
ncbi:hypothetical protein JOF53_003610 [Crossiella equi]|uniref:GIY-YIG nuclease family protein n=1 Tax=Crossiella equi TaxID=130796 RepID=A0ABS5ADS7_9PSEU|nr:hypothetical protein [Crossiella equi]MBP2474738.1 hypothetical protein [Crossiella equi]